MKINKLSAHSMFVFVGITVGFDQDSYSVNETDGSVTLVVRIIDGSLGRPATVNFFTTDGTATSVAPIDFMSVTGSSLIFGPSTTSLPVVVSIVDDNIVENPEFFFGNLSTTDGAVLLAPDFTTVTILEVIGDDSKQI